MAYDSFEVVGGHQIGDKAAYLQEFQPLVSEVGLRTPATIVLASELVRANVDVTLNQPTHDALEIAALGLGYSPVLAVRSSAAGDGSGNGVYESRFATNDLGILVNEAKMVLASFGSEAAQDFRRQATVGDDFALIVQPVIGQVIDSSQHWLNFGPYISGHGYSSTDQHPGGYLNVVAGIGGGVSRKGGQFVSPESLAQSSADSWDRQFKQDPKAGTFFDYLDAINEAYLGRPAINTDFLGRENFISWNATWPDSYAMAQYLHRRIGTTAYEYQPNGIISTGKIDNYKATKFAGALKHFIPGQFLDALQTMEQRAGHPLYVEWALASGTRAEEHQPIIVQIAPAQQTAQAKLTAEVQGKTLSEAELLTGQGVRKATKIVIIENQSALLHLREFNHDPANEGYILLFHEARASSLSYDQLAYRDCSKAGVLLEVASTTSETRHYNGDILEHLFGASRQTNKMVGRLVSPYGKRTIEIWQHVQTSGQTWQSSDKNQYDYENSGITVLDGDFNVYADSRQGRIIIAEE